MCIEHPKPLSTISKGNAFNNVNDDDLTQKHGKEAQHHQQSSRKLPRGQSKIRKPSSPRRRTTAPSTPERTEGTSSSSSSSSTSSCASTASSTLTDCSSESPECSTSTSTSKSTKTTRTTAILDWDDTICPSSALASLGLRVDDASQLPLQLRQQLEQLELAVIHIVEQALRFGNVVIITNAEAGWVELSGRRFLPRVVSLLNRHSIKIVSARSCFEAHYPDAPSSWKCAAFEHEVDAMFPDHQDELNVLVLGDSMSERDAAHALSLRLPKSKVKTVKFVERPSIDQLMRQVQLVTQSLPDLATYASSFDIDLVVSANA